MMPSVGSEPGHRPPACQVIKQHDAFRHPQRIVVGDTDDASAEPDVPGALGGGGDHDFRRGGKLGPGGVVFAEPRLVVATAIKPLDQLKITLQSQRRVDTGLVERREKNTKA
jgi:hypothetical protein